MRGRGLRKKSCVIGVLAAMVVVATGFGAQGAGSVTPAQSSSALGTKNPAKGTPVKIGYVSDDANEVGDTSIETPVAMATYQWLNQYMNGVGGHPIELISCFDYAVPSRGTDCANEMIAEDVAAVVMGGNAVIGNVWAPLHEAGIPVFAYGASNPDLTGDTDTTFIMTNGQSTLVSLPVGVAKENKAKKVTVVSVDIPAATSFFKDPGPELYEEQGIDLELVPVPSGTADMTAQMQRVVSGNPKGVTFILGGDAFCIPAFNGLRTASFKGQVTAVTFCITDATREAVPGEFLDGIKISSTSPIDDPKDPSMKQYYAVLDKYGASDVDKTDLKGLSMYMALSGLSVATQNLKGEATPKSIAAAAKAMEWSVLPGTGGTHIRCNGKADPTQPAVCTNATLAATLDADGVAKSYAAVGDERIPG